MANSNKRSAKRNKGKLLEGKKGNEYPGIYYEAKKNTWGFRLSQLDSRHKLHDTNRGNFKTPLQAKKARDALIYEWKHMPPVDMSNENMDLTKTFKDVFDDYLKNRAFEKREATVRKHLSLWENHIKGVFGDKKLSEVSKADMENYLLRLYHKGDSYNSFERGYAYGYVESFLKFFWLIYGYANDNNWVDHERYARDFTSKSTKLRMPKKLEDDEDKIEIYSREEIEKIESVMRRGNLYITFLICYLCGLRISECMGLMWKDFDEKNHKLHIRRQMLYSNNDKVFYLGPTKTKKGKRTVSVPDKLYNYLLSYKEQQKIDKQSKGYKNTEIVYDRNGKDKDEKLVGGDFIQRKENGELITINSVKYWTNRVKEETGINFHFHALRHTNASMLAARNIPVSTLAEHLGHANTNVCQEYYVTTTQFAEDNLRAALNEL